MRRKWRICPFSYASLLYRTGKWTFNTSEPVESSPVIGTDDTIYFGTTNIPFLFALNQNGTEKWRFRAGLAGQTSSPGIGHDGTIYVGSSDSNLYAINQDGTEKWRKSIGGDVDSAPAIDENGIVYIASPKVNEGYLRALGYPGPNPLAPTIDGPSSGKPGTPYTYTFTSIDPDEDDVYYYILWGDGYVENWVGPHPSGIDFEISHTYKKQGTFTIKAKSRDSNGYESGWASLNVTMPRNKIFRFNFGIIDFLNERFPYLFSIFRYILEFQ